MEELDNLQNDKYVSRIQLELDKKKEDKLKLDNERKLDKNRNRENDSKFHSPDLNFHTKMGELLICLACEYWMDTATIVRSHSEFSKYSSARNQNRTC